MKIFQNLQITKMKEKKNLTKLVLIKNEISQKKGTK